MGETRGLYTLEEWDDLALRKLVFEPSFSPLVPNTGIGCPNILNPGGHICGAHVFDRGRRVVVGKEVREWIICKCCGWDGTRRIAPERTARLRVVE